MEKPILIGVLILALVIGTLWLTIWLSPQRALRRLYRESGKIVSIENVGNQASETRGTILYDSSMRVFFWVPSKIDSCSTLPDDALLIQTNLRTRSLQQLMSMCSSVTIVTIKDIGENTD